MASDTRLTLRTWHDEFQKETGISHRFTLSRFRGYFLEWEDLHFNHDSSVLIADHRKTSRKDDNSSKEHVGEHITALDVIATTYRQIEENPKQRLLLVGHTDRSGDASYNLNLSTRRAENLLHVLRGNKEAWAKHNEPTTHHKVEDYQQLLTWLYKEHGWDTDPGEIDNKLSPKTKAAVKRFQTSYNQQFGQSIAEDGIVGRETWAAFFDIYMQELRTILEIDVAGLAVKQRELPFLNNPECVGCGENFPKTSLNRSRTDRRVELFFFDPGEEPNVPLRCHPSSTKCVKDACELRNEKLYKLEPISVRPSNINTIQIRLFDPCTEYIPNSIYRLNLGGQLSEATADDEGFIIKEVDQIPDDCTIDWGEKDEAGNYHYSLKVYLQFSGVSDNEAVKRRLHNLGYFDTQDLSDNVRTFQRDYNYPVTGRADDIKDILVAWHNNPKLIKSRSGSN